MTIHGEMLPYFTEAEFAIEQFCLHWVKKSNFEFLTANGLCSKTKDVSYPSRIYLWQKSMKLHLINVLKNINRGDQKQTKQKKIPGTKKHRYNIL